MLQSHSTWFILICFGCTALGALLYMFPMAFTNPGIKNDHIYHNSATNKGAIGITVGTFQ